MFPFPSHGGTIIDGNCDGNTYLPDRGAQAKRGAVQELAGGQLIFMWTVRRHLLPVVVGLSVAQLAAGAEGPENRLERIYREARLEVETANTNAIEPLWKFARACFDYG